MTEIDKRAFVAAMYPSEGWKKKVAEMDEAQVTAIFIKEQARQREEAQKPKETQDDIPF